MYRTGSRSSIASRERRNLVSAESVTAYRFLSASWRSSQLSVHRCPIYRAQFPASGQCRAQRQRRHSLLPSGRRKCRPPCVTTGKPQAFSGTGNRLSCASASSLADAQHHQVSDAVVIDIERIAPTTSAISNLLVCLNVPATTRALFTRAAGAPLARTCPGNRP